ncbi:MAG TPA: metallophosphoesterase family protein [Bryobacteraceae bacterium]|nr:metallophosphoesterase family protein [Bryobacteraceae bacterium]
MRYLILSDLHANWEALEAVLNDASGRYDEVLCCGDLVGYGADPNAVVEWVCVNCRVVVRGNHDKAATGAEDLEWFNPIARTAAIWTQQQLAPGNADYVRGLPEGPVDTNGFQLVHGSPLDEDEYLVGCEDAAESFPYLSSKLVFFGHTHLQGGFLWNHSRVESIRGTAPRSHRQLLEIDPKCAYLINPGSVGQPRDGDPRAAYILYDSDAAMLAYRRVRYDLDQAQRKILNAGLPPTLAERLAVGR